MIATKVGANRDEELAMDRKPSCAVDPSMIVAGSVSGAFPPPTVAAGTAVPSSPAPAGTPPSAASGSARASRLRKTSSSGTSQAKKVNLSPPRYRGRCGRHRNSRVRPGSAGQSRRAPRLSYVVLRLRSVSTRGYAVRHIRNQRPAL